MYLFLYVHFIRTGKGVKLSEQGEKFLPYAQNIVANYKEYLRSVETERPMCIFRLYTTHVLADRIANLQELFFDENSCLSIHQNSLDEICTMIEDKQEGIYFVPAISKYASRIQNVKDRIVIANETTMAYYCHRSNPALQENGAIQELISDNVVIMNSQIDSALLNDTVLNKNNFVTIEDMTVCKKYMKEKNFFFYGMPFLYDRVFSDDEWVVLANKECVPIEFTIIFCLLGKGNTNRIKTKLVDVLKNSLKK